MNFILAGRLGNRWLLWLILLNSICTNDVIGLAKSRLLAQSASVIAAPPSDQRGATPPTAPRSESASGLTEGLLDLLTEPSVRQQPQKAAPPRAADRKTDSDDVGDQSGPLQTVRKNMLLVAGFLEQGQAGANTQQLQSDIVKRLDELIDQLDQPQQSPSSSGDSRQPQSRDSAQQRGESQKQQVSRAQRQQSSAQPGDPKQGAGDGQSSNDPNSGQFQQAGPRSTKVQLSDPKALQQQVWGQLPERIRQQMQSRMVEQFLPSYRQEIEAYYRALAK